MCPDQISSPTKESESPETIKLSDNQEELRCLQPQTLSLFFSFQLVARVRATGFVVQRRAESILRAKSGEQPETGKDKSSAGEFWTSRRGIVVLKVQTSSRSRH